MNRFFRPTQARYKSQFVPVNLPVDLMAKTLYAKQGKADQMLAASVKLGEFEQAALKGRDTQYVEDIKSEVQQFASDAMSQDRTSPEFQRKYLMLTNKIKNDKNLKKIQASVDTHNAYLERHKELIKKGNGAAAQELEADYLWRFANYTKKDGKGFEGPLGLGDAGIQEGRDYFGDALEIFTPLKASGSEGVKFLGSGIAYKNGWTGISSKRVKEQAERMYGNWKTTDAFKQEKLRLLMQAGLVETQYNALDKDTKAKLDKELDNMQRNNFLNVGRTVIHGKSTTNVDQAYRAQHKYDMENKAVILPTETKVLSTGATTNQGRDNKIKELLTNRENIQDQLNENNKRINNGLDPSLTPSKVTELKKQMNNIDAQRDYLVKTKNADWTRLKEKQDSKFTGKFDKAGKNLNSNLESSLASIAEMENSFNGLNMPKSVLSKLNTIKTRLESLRYDNKGLTSHKNANAATFLQGELGDLQEGLLAIMGNRKRVANNTRGGDWSKDQQYLNADKANQIFTNLLNPIKVVSKYQAEMDSYSNKAYEATNSLWAKNYQKPGTISNVQIQGSTVRTDNKSVMAAINQDIPSNLQNYNLMDSNGNPIVGDVVEFSGNSVTNANMPGMGNIGINGSVKVRRPVMVEDEQAVDGNGNPKFETVTIPATAIKMGNAGKLTTRMFAQEQYNTAQAMKTQGRSTEYQVALNNAIQLWGQDIRQKLDRFAGDRATSFVLSTPIVSGTGEAMDKPGLYNVKKIGSQYEVITNGIKLTNANNEPAFNTVAEVNQAIQEVSGTQIGDY